MGSICLSGRVPKLFAAVGAFQAGTDLSMHAKLNHLPGCQYSGQEPHSEPFQKLPIRTRIDFPAEGAIGDIGRWESPIDVEYNVSRGKDHAERGNGTPAVPVGSPFHPCKRAVDVQVCCNRIINSGSQETRRPLNSRPKKGCMR